MLAIVKNTTILNPLDLIMPHSCRGCGYVGDVLCGRCKNYIISSRENLCPSCKQPSLNGKCPNCPNLPPAFSLGPREGLLNDLVHDLKYHSVRALGVKLAKLLDATLPQDLDQAVIVPIPTATHHIRARGLDHTLLIAKHLSRLRCYQVEKLLLRTKNTTQVGANRTARLNQAEAAFSLNKHCAINPDRTYILLDDVWTTGATMKSAIKKLRNSGAKNIVIALLVISCI